MLRPLLILAFLASLGGALFAYLKVKPDIDLINTTLAATKADLSKTQGELTKASKDARESKAAREAAEKTLASTKESLDAATTKASELEVRSTKLTADLGKTTSERNDARNELAQWVATGFKPKDIDQLKVGKKFAEDERDNLAAEKVIFLRRIQSLQGKLDQFQNPDQEVALPVGLAGNVIAVDPKWNFVLLDIGSNAGLLERGQLKIHRDGKLVGKVRVVSVTPTTAIGNVIAEWRQPDQTVAEGDKVLF